MNARPVPAPGPPEVPGIGTAARAARTSAVDAWLRSLLPPVPGVALLAVGGLGRGECLRRADLDLVLVHTGRPDVYRLADAVWYPVWDAGWGLDHAVRTVPEALRLAADDVKVALGLLDARLVAGDQALAMRVRDVVRVDWRRHTGSWLSALRELTTQRWDRHGELAHLAEGDLKESRGGLRDAVVLRAMGLTQAVPTPWAAVSTAYRHLLDTREALHAVAHRRLDRPVPDLLPSVAGLLRAASTDRDPGPDGDDPVLALRRAIADDARTIGYAIDDAWRAADRWRAGRSRRPGRGGPVRRPLAAGVVEQGGEVVLAREALTGGDRPDPALSVRTVAAAARYGLPVAAATLDRLASTGGPPPEPWPPGFREAFAVLLGAGPGLVDAWEAADRYGLVTRWLPEIGVVRNLPPGNPVHRHTVDRHLVQTVVCAAAQARTVARPDLLYLAALLHDLGKGVDPAHHAVAGAALAAPVVRRMGLPAVDARTVVRLVRHHLLLPDTATRRDLSDPRTLRAVARLVPDTGTLDLLAALSRADAQAAGPLAASEWRMRLMDDLVGHTRALLRSGEPPRPAPPDPALAALSAGPVPEVRVDGDTVCVVAPAGTQPLAPVAGCLAMHRLAVVGADVHPLTGGADESGGSGPGGDGAPAGNGGAGGADGSGAAAGAGGAQPPAGSAPVAVVCRVRPEFASRPSTELLAADLRRAVQGTLPVAERLAARARGYLGRQPAGGASGPSLLWHGDATGAVVLELRAADAVGLLYRVASALAGIGAWVRAARVDTLGPDAVDCFYLVGDWSRADRRAEVERAVLAALPTD